MRLSGAGWPTGTTQLQWRLSQGSRSAQLNSQHFNFGSTSTATKSRAPTSTSRSLILLTAPRASRRARCGFSDLAAHHTNHPALTTRTLTLLCPPPIAHSDASNNISLHALPPSCVALSASRERLVWPVVGSK